MSASKITQAVKTTTGLTGLKVVANPKHNLGLLYSKILRALAKMPQDAAYRKYTEAIVSKRAAIVNQATSSNEIEEKIQCGQVEELIIQAENELSLARNFNVWKPWEKLVVTPPPNQWTWPPPSAV